MAAIWAARGGADTVLLEGASACGAKILISGGGRCNVLPSRMEAGDFFTSGSRNVLARLFRTWWLEEVIGFFEQDLGIPLKLEEETGKLFPESDRARPVRDRLVRAVEEAGGRIRCGWRVADLERLAGGGFLLTGTDGKRLEAERVILATGGKSVPKTGSDGFGWKLAAGLGHKLLPAYPALVALTSKDASWSGLAGVALPVAWRAVAGGRTLQAGRGPLLFTHHGFSGPAVLDASHWVVRDGATLEVAWAGLSRAAWEDHWKSRGRRQCARALADKLPRRLAELLPGKAGLRPDRRIGDLDRAARNRLLGALCAFPLPVHGNEGFRTAEVTGGGVPLGEVTPSTLESRRAPGLYLCGEMLDVLGPIGGYNFLWAWVTGRLAGLSAARACPG